jgi:hypothetical protein
VAIVFSSQIRDQKAATTGRKTLENQAPVRMNGPIHPFKQADGSARRAVFDIKVHSDGLRTD